MKTLLAVLLLMPAVSFACVHSVEVTDTYAKVCAASDSCRTVLYQSIPNTSQARKNEMVREGLQFYLDTREELALFPPEDPVKAEDPNCENWYWGLSDGTPESDPLDATHLIARDCIVENVTFDGVQYNFVIRRANRCQ